MNQRTMPKKMAPASRRESFCTPRVAFELLMEAPRNSTNWPTWTNALAVAAWLWGASAHAASYQVGPGRACPTVASLPALKAGDIVEIAPGVYHEVKRWTNPGTAAHPITIRGVGDSRPVFDASGLMVDGRMPNPRAVFQVEADYLVLENLEFKNARNGDNGSGLRVTGGNFVTVRGCKITQCDMGIMSDSCRGLLIESSEIAANGTASYDGYSHNLYLGGKSATIRFCYIHDALFGQNFKTRAHYTELLYNLITDSQDGEIGLVDSAETAATNSHAVMIGNIVVSKPRAAGYNSGRFIQFGQDAGGQHNGTLFAFNNTWVAGDGRIQFLSANTAGARITAVNNIFYGSNKIPGTVGGGITGSNNWAAASAAIPATFLETTQGTDPGFAKRAARDFRLTASSPCRNRGLNGLAFLDGEGNPHPGQPSLEYQAPLRSRARPQDGQLDLGAYEYCPPAFSGLKPGSRGCLIGFTSQGGDLYELQATQELPAGTWLTVAAGIAGSDGPIELTDPDAVREPKRFYRLRVMY